MVRPRPIAGVDLEAEQVVEEESEKPIRPRRHRQPSLVAILAVVLGVQTVVAVVLFGRGDEPAPTLGTAHADGGLDVGRRIDATTLEEIGRTGLLTVGDVSITEASRLEPGRSLETTIVELQIGIAKEAWEQVRKVVQANPDAETLIIMDVRRHVRDFMATEGGESLAHRQESLEEDLLRYLHGLNRDTIGGLSAHITTVGYQKVKSVQR